MRETMRQWRLHRQTDRSLDEPVYMINPVVRGWINYYGNFYKSALYPTFQRMNNILVRWATRKYKRLRGHNRRALHWLQQIVHKQPELFAHWRLHQFKAGQ
jgi:RNA-directed DNA polymerase